MGQLYDQLDERLCEFIAAQRVFFVATAPLSASGHVNLSPKGLDSFRVLGPTLVGYVDYTGSGVETIAHIRENGRLTIQFCAFEGPPKILRLYGRGRVLEPAEAEYAARVGAFSLAAAARALVLLDVTRIADSCGFAVPRYEYRGERDQLPRWCERKGETGLRDYQREKNARSIDGLPGLRGAGD